MLAFVLSGAFEKIAYAVSYSPTTGGKPVENVSTCTTCDKFLVKSIIQHF
ncbi:DUF1541 domain-containing protein [Paucisalibacillus sp. EB02]